jgi:hypothetical protein
VEAPLTAARKEALMAAQTAARAARTAARMAARMRTVVAAETAAETLPFWGLGARMAALLPLGGCQLRRKSPQVPIGLVESNRSGGNFFFHPIPASLHDPFLNDFKGLPGGLN